MFKEEIAKYIREHCLYEAEGLMYGKLPGTRYKTQYYLSNGLYDRNFLDLVADSFGEIVRENIGDFDFQLAGRSWSAVPLLIGIPMYLRDMDGIEINSFMIKPERKSYGLHNYIEGRPNEKPVLLVDDLCNSTDSFRFCRDVLDRTTNLKTVPFIFAVLNKYGKADEGYMFDRYLGDSHKALSIVTGDDIRALG